jgi:hypothetical protein
MKSSPSTQIAMNTVNDMCVSKLDRYKNYCPDRTSKNSLALNLLGKLHCRGGARPSRPLRLAKNLPARRLSYLSRPRVIP